MKPITFLIIILILFILINSIIAPAPKTEIESEEHYFESKEETQNKLEKFFEFLKPKQIEQEEGVVNWNYSP